LSGSASTWSRICPSRFAACLCSLTDLLWLSRRSLVTLAVYADTLHANCRSGSESCCRQREGQDPAQNLGEARFNKHECYGRQAETDAAPLPSFCRLLPSNGRLDWISLAWGANERDRWRPRRFCPTASRMRSRYHDVHDTLAEGLEAVRLTPDEPHRLQARKACSAGAWSGANPFLNTVDPLTALSPPPALAQHRRACYNKGASIP
jgi:hypothetical protein